MELRFAHLADYAAGDAAGKLTIVGIFDIVFDQAKTRPIAFPPCYLIANFASSVAEGSVHRLEVRLVDADENNVVDPIKAELTFRPFGPGYPQRAVFLAAFAPETVKVPILGDYHFVFLIDGAEVGRVSVSVLEPPPTA